MKGKRLPIFLIILALIGLAVFANGALVGDDAKACPEGFEPDRDYTENKTRRHHCIPSE